MKAMSIDGWLGQEWLAKYVSALNGQKGRLTVKAIRQQRKSLLAHTHSLHPYHSPTVPSDHLTIIFCPIPKRSMHSVTLS
jgi:hypothetical protein